MKDSYTLDRDRDGLEEGYARHEVAYDRILTRAGLDFWKVESDTGMMGGFGAHEYMAPSPAGEDRVALCQNGDYAANVELAVSVPERPSFPPSQASAEVETPGVGTIEALAAYLGIDARTTMKAVLVVPEDERGGVVLALVRGDHRVHELKLTKALGTTFRPADARGDPVDVRGGSGLDRRGRRPRRRAP
jgi:prolyl-tRNA synthetase